MVFYPNLKFVQTGVSSTIFALSRILPSFGIDILVLGLGLPSDVQRSGLFTVLRCLFSSKTPMIWHARRNIEMLAGLMLRALNAKLILVFTSAAQRHHTSYTSALIAAMDCIISTSDKSARYVAREAQIVAHGVDTTRFVPQGRAVARRRAGLDEHCHYIGSFGAVRASKGSDLLVEALIAVLRSRPAWRALFVGHFGVRQSLYVLGLKRRLAKECLLARVDFIAHVPDVIGYMQAMDICVAASRKEGFGLTALEAMACGVPVIASRAGSFPETVIDGQTGLLFDTGDAEALAGRLETLMDDDGLRQDMAARGRDDVMARFALEREAEALAQLYRHLIEARARA
jgi:mannosyltransferase